MQRKIYREHRKTLSETIHGQIMDKLKRQQLEADDGFSN